MSRHDASNLHMVIPNVKWRDRLVDRRVIDLGGGFFMPFFSLLTLCFIMDCLSYSSVFFSFLFFFRLRRPFFC